MFAASVRERMWAYQESRDTFAVITQRRSPSRAAPPSQRLWLAWGFSHTGLEVALLPGIPGALFHQACERKQLCDL